MVIVASRQGNRHNSGRHLCPEIQINGRMLNLDVSVTECPVAHQRKPPPFLFVLVSVFRLGLRLLFLPLSVFHTTVSDGKVNEKRHLLRY